ncbi:carboxymuconolactone decarboxylase family protein [Oceanibaculum pacificum]|uniref:Carboxymuconolactone decarboxylase-like domain-containing protein n=1 Tax=Oceanibaculum pacificum TaxID=580166 RepID=A0A154W1N4_9PROT|nr:carboxymuconolactone decarboxylase family protein [Oceanibaculum pacificum]KZD07399.1 hypothetical protein AUP43_02445 [Oceanibaculum pacificum]
MTRVRPLSSMEIPLDLAAVYEEFADNYGPFRNQVAVLAHVPSALRHLMPMLLELRRARTLPKRYLEIAILTVSKLNECDYCVSRHAPFLAEEGVSEAGIERLLDYANHPELNAIDKLVAEYAAIAWTRPGHVPDSLFEQLRLHFSEAQIVELTLRITLCGFFNKFNEALRIGDETPTAQRLAS